MGGPGSGRPPEGAARASRGQVAVVAPPGGFVACRFMGYLLEGTVRFDRTGGLMVTFGVPAGAVDEALGLRQYLVAAPPLSITVEPHPDWVGQAASNGARRAERERRAG